MDTELLETLGRIAAALERLAPPPPDRADLHAADAFVWHPADGALVPVPEVSRVGIEMLHGIDRQKTLVLDNTMRFAAGLLGPATQFLPLVLIFGVFYFLLIRPQQTRQKELKASLAALRRGDRVVTAGGILGTVQRVKEGSDEIEVDIAPNVRVTVLRDTITTIVKPVAANDTK